MAAVGLDRFLRVWETKGKTKLIHKVKYKKVFRQVLPLTLFFLGVFEATDDKFDYR